MKFRLPRKIKKKLKWGIYLYPMGMYCEVKSCFLIASPTRKQRDYTDYKAGILEKIC